MNFEEILPGRREWEVFENIVSKIIKNTLTLRFPRIRHLHKNKLVFINNKETLYYRVAESEKFADFFWVDVVGQELDDGLAVRVHHGLALFLQKKIIN